MSADTALIPNTCGCCQVEGVPTPIAVSNRPGLSSIRYRVGTYSSFLLAMTEQIARTPELSAKFLTRSTDDFGIALLAMWSWIADILTFYQERIANEAYLRTAIMPESVTALAALLGYTIAPGAAAEADLVFLLDPDKQVTIPVGLRVQSVPGQNEKPQKFETANTVNAAAALNQIDIFPAPAPYSPFAAGSGQAVLLSDPTALTPGTTFAIFNAKRAELKQAAGVSLHNSQQVLAWNPAIQSADFTPTATQAVVYGRQFRLFGYNVPSSYLQATPDPTAPGGMRWVMLTFPYANSTVPPPPGNRLALDATYKDLKPGAALLVSQAGSGASPTDTFAQLVNVTAVTTELATDGPLQNAVTWVTLDQPVGPVTDVRRVTVFEILQVLSFSQVQYPDSIGGGLIYVPLPELPAIDNKRFIMLDDAAANPQTVQIDGVQQIDANGDGVPDHWQIAFSPGLSRNLATASAVLYGNVCSATHGETVAGEVLGDGSASATFQSFQPRKSPVTFVHHPGSPHGVANTLQIQSNGVIWQEVPSFFGHGPNERIFVTSEDSGGMTVQFGDGITGRRLTTGRGNVSATYRQGIGLVGNVPALALRTLLDRPVGLKSVSNPAPASGGADPESLDQARTNAPNTVRTFGRIVSLRDFEDAAREFAGVAKAHSSWEWGGEEQVVYVTVAGEGGAPITGQTYADLVADLDSRRDPNRAMRVRNYDAIPIQLAATIFVKKDYVPDDVLAAVESEVALYFAFDNRQFGEPVHLSNVYAALQSVAGVDGVDITLLQYKNPSDAATHGATAASVQIHMRINDNELATLADPIADAVITLGTTPA